MSSYPIYPAQKYSNKEISGSCRGALHLKAIAGIRLFNQGEYFEAHEELELAWRDEVGPVREVYRGVLQIGVAYYHILNGNFTGAVKMFRRAWPWLAPYPDNCRGIDLAKLREDARRVEAEILSLGEGRLQEFDRSLLQPVQLIITPEENDDER